MKAGKPPSRGESYHPVSLLSYAAELLERLIYQILVWFLEKNVYLPVEVTDFQTHLVAQDSILSLTSDIEFNRQRGLGTLAVFLDVNRACDSVSVPIIISRLRELRLRGILRGFLCHYLVWSTFAV